MRLRGFVLSLVGFWSCASALNSQTLPCASADTGENLTCAQGSSFSYDLGQEFEQLAAIFNGIDGISYTYTFEVSGGNLPPGITLSPSGLFTGTLTAAGQFDFTVTFTETLAVDGEVILTEAVPFPLSVVVTGYSGPPVAIDPSGLSFKLTQGAPALTKSVTISNHGNQPAQFSASVTTNTGGDWLKLSPSGGSTPSFGSSGLAVTADASHLMPGTYSGTVTISILGGPTLSASVLAVVAGTQPNIQLSQTGLRFQAVSGGTATSPQTITVLNPGSGSLNFAASASTISGGSWLKVSPASGTSSSSSAHGVTVSVNASGLQPGDYYGRIQFSASGAVNSPQIASVVLNVLPLDKSPGAFVQPTGLIFVGSAGGTDPVAKTVSITNPSPTPLTYLVTSFGSSGGSNWFTSTPASGSVSATQPGTVTVQTSLKGLKAGVYTGDLAINIAPADVSALTPQTFHIEVLLLVLPAGVSPLERSALEPRATGCTPTKLLPVFTLLGTGFTAAVAWPTAIEVTVVDDCGKPLVTGSVTATFSSGDAALALDSLNDGRWTATWNATHVAPGVTITAQAQEVEPALTGTSSIGGTLQPNTATPSVSAGGVVSAANFTANQPLAPGAFAAIFGSNLSEGTNVSTQLPLSFELGNTFVVLAGQQLPLLFTSGQQINVVVPYDVPVNSTQQLVVQRGSSISIPQSVVISPAQPAIFTVNGFGTEAAVINVYKPDGTALPNNSPVGAGYVITLYCSGLGAVDPPVTAGSQAPASPLSSTVNPVTVKIGETDAHVLFAGLAPSFAQLYQVNVQIPPGLPSGNAVLTLSVGGQQSAPVIIAIQ